MYLNAFERRIIPGAVALSLVYLPDRARSLPIDVPRNSLPIEVNNNTKPMVAHRGKNFSKSIAHRGRNLSLPHFSVRIIAINNDIN